MFFFRTELPLRYHFEKVAPEKTSMQKIGLVGCFDSHSPRNINTDIMINEHAVHNSTLCVSVLLKCQYYKYLMMK